MYHDKIIEEVWRNRDAYAKSHNYSLDEIVKDLRKRQQKHSQRIISTETISERLNSSEVPV